jgi:hypothetical protein
MPDVDGAHGDKKSGVDSPKSGSDQANPIVAPVTDDAALAKALAPNCALLLALVFFMLLTGFLVFCLAQMQRSMHRALGQIEYFFEKVEQAEHERSWAHVYRDAIQTHYPSGTRQSEGSYADRIVETCRQHAIADVERMALRGSRPSAGRADVAAGGVAPARMSNAMVRGVILRAGDAPPMEEVRR